MKLINVPLRRALPRIFHAINDRESKSSAITEKINLFFFRFSPQFRDGALKRGGEEVPNVVKCSRHFHCRGQVS